jgi:hypothetical protein
MKEILFLLFVVLLLLKSRDSSVGIATGYGLDDQGFVVLMSSSPALGVKRPEHGADLSSTISAKVKNTSTPPYTFIM